MSEQLMNESLFRPKQSKAETKADTTNRAARMMIEAEAARQAAKTARLRKLRLAQEQEAPAAAPKTSRRRAKSAK